MTRLVVAGFAGANLALDPLLLPEAVGVDASNMKRTRGNLQPWNAPLTVATVPTSPQRLTIYRMGRDTVSDTNYWLSWSTVVHAIRGFNAQDTTERTIFTGSGTPKWTDNVLGLAGAPYPTATRELGVPAPTTTHTVTMNTDGTGGTPETVYTLITFVNDQGEESAGGPVSTGILAHDGAILNVTSLPAAPGGAYGITHRRIYATKVGDNSTNYFLAKEVTIATSSTTIDLGDLNDVWVTADYDMPPADGHHLTTMWLGMAAMASGKSVRVCEAFTISAWPDTAPYKIIVPDTVVGLGVFDQNLLVLTTGKPAIITGQEPGSLSSSPIELDQSCVSGRGIVSFGFGVVWPSPDGLMLMTSAGPRNLLDGLLTRDDWQALQPTTLVGSSYEQQYLGVYTIGGVRKGFLIDPRNPGGIVFLSSGYHALYRDTVIDALFVLSTGNVQKWDAGATAMTATFKSKEFHLDHPVNFMACQVLAKTFTAVTVKIYANGVLRMTRSVTSSKPFRIPVKNRATSWQVEISTQSPISSVVLAESMKELDGAYA